MEKVLFTIQNLSKTKPMKTKSIILLLVCSFLYNGALFAQASTAANNPFAQTDFLGWDANTNLDLEIRHDGPRPIIFSTNQLERMRLTPDGTLLIGVTTPTFTGGSKLEVQSTTLGNTAISGVALGANIINVGGYFRSSGSTVAIGLRGEAILTAAETNYGVYGEACSAPTNYAVYGLACDEGEDSWAGFFNGKTFCSSGVWDASDAQLKTNVNPLNEATEMLMALNPKSYHFIQDIPNLNLPSGMQYGVLAQEL
jgi:hypothetical protein